MKSYPITIDNGHGEQLTFVGLTSRNGLPCLDVENFLSPGSGPPMHVHYKQDESLTVLEGQMGIQILGQKPVVVGAGETVIFEKNIPHRFYNAGQTALKCKGQVWPVHNLEYFLTAMYKSTKESKNGRPDNFDTAFLLHRYRSEFGMHDIPAVVKKLVFPLTLFAGKLQGKHKKFADAPPPV
jgi:quercetin dioxygenase-like cupin family protein